MDAFGGIFFGAQTAAIRAAGVAVAAVCAVASAFFICACGERETPAQTAAKEKILLLGNAADPEGLDPSLTTGLAEFKILCALFEGLVTLDEKTLQPCPAAAKSWTVSDGGKIYTFKIDPNAKWSNGEKLSSRDFEFAWKRAINPLLGAEYASMLDFVKNAEKIRLGKLPTSELAVSCPDDETFKVELERPAPSFLSALYHQIFFPLHRRTLEKFGADNSRNAIWTRPPNIVSNGAFTLEKWSINNLVEVAKSRNYREYDKIKLNKIRYFPISNINTEDMAFRAGQLHATESVAPMRLKKIRENSPETLRNASMLGTYYYLFNAARPPLNDPRVRMALSAAIDRRLIIKNTLRGGQRPAFNFVPPNCGGYTAKSDAQIRENIAEARRLLAEAGYPDGKNFPRIKVVYNTSEQHKPIAEAIGAMWKKNLGVEVELYNLSWPAYLDARKRGDFDVARSSWIADYPAPENFLENFASDSLLNHSQYKDAAFDAALKRAENASDNTVRMEALAEADRRLTKTAAMMPVYFYSKVSLVSPLLVGWTTNALDYHNYKNTDFAKPSSVATKQSKQSDYSKRAKAKK